MEPGALEPHFPGCKRRKASGRGLTSLHHARVLQHHARWDGLVCGDRSAKSLSIRTHVCPRCGYVADSDENAARNIQGRGQRAPAGTRGDAGGGEPRTRGALAPAECQKGFQSSGCGTWKKQ
jgi:Putative transposase DNA-binding domain